MNPESITKLTSGLFDDIKNMKDAKDYSRENHIKPDDYKKYNLSDSPNSFYSMKDNLDNSDSSDSSDNSTSLSSKKLYDYPEEYIKKYNKEYGDDLDDEFDNAEERILDDKFRKTKYELLPEVKNPLKNFYNEIINDDVFKYIKPEKKNKYAKRKLRSSDLSFEKEFNSIVNKVNKKLYKWIEDYKIFDYIIKSGKKYKIASSKNKMDTSKKPTLAKLKYLDKLIKKGKFTEQVVKKFIEKYNMTPKLISTKEINTMIKPFYEKCLIKAFERKIKYSRRG